MIRRWGLLGVLLAASVTVLGCPKTVSVVFVNQTRYTMPLEVQPPDGQRDFVGLLEPIDGAVKTKVSVAKDALPVRVRWWAGARDKGEFDVTAATDKTIRIDLRSDGPTEPYPWKGKIKTK